MGGLATTFDGNRIDYGLERFAKDPSINPFVIGKTFKLQAQLMQRLKTFVKL